MGSENSSEHWTSILPYLPRHGHAKPAPKQLRDWALVLSARNIPYQTDNRKKPTDIHIPAAFLDIARHEINLYQSENQQGEMATIAEISLADNALTSLIVLIFLGVFHNLTYSHISGFGHVSIDWLQHGSADSGKILAGEWWRIITALTLHADGQHLLGNVLIGGYFTIRLCQVAGSGLGWLLIIASGALGNLFNAILHGAGHNAVGASTAIFGAIGIAGALNTVFARRRLARYWLLPFAAAAVLLAFLGAGNENGRTDIGAHLLGFLAGLGIGIPAGFFLAKRGQPEKAGNIIMAGAGTVMVIGCWLIALLRG